MSNFNPVDVRLLLPMILVSIGAMSMLMLQVFQRARTSRAYMAWVAVLFLMAAGLDSAYLLGEGVSKEIFGGSLVVDSFSLVFNMIFVLGASLASLISPAYLASHRMDRGEYYALLLFSTVGMMTMASAMDLFTMFIGLEMMSIPVYCLAGFFRHSSRSAESAMKYFLLGAFASAFLLYGISLIYGVVGSTDLETIARVLESNVSFLRVGGVHHVTGEQVTELALLPGLGMLLILVALAFKNAAVPFHMWTPDVYTGAPSSVTSFMATGVKAASFAALIRVFCVGFFGEAARLSGTGWVIALFWLALFSMILGNVAAMVQRNVKRMLAYSSIAHAGYILVGLLAASYQSERFLNMESVLFYLLAYTLTTAGAFGVLAYVGKRGEEAVTYDDLAGLAQRHPGAALAMTVFMLSSAGIPPTAGFVAKFYAFKAAVQTGERLFIILAIVGILFSVAGVYYYLRVVVSMYMKDARREVAAVPGVPVKLAMVISAVGVLIFGLLPSSGLDLVRKGVLGMHGMPTEVREAMIKQSVKVQQPERVVPTSRRR